MAISAKAHSDELANRKRLGELIQDGYKAAGLTRRSLSQKVGVSERSLYSLEAGERVPREITQRRIEEVLSWRRGAMIEILGLGPDSDLPKVPLSFMQESKRIAWANMSQESGADVIHRLSAAATDAAVMLREKDRRIQELEQQVAELQSRYGLSVDRSPKKGTAGLEHVDSVAQEDQGTLSRRL